MSSLYVTAKCSDCCVVEFDDINHHGYVPYIPGIGNGDYIHLEIDNETGKIVGWKPLTVASFKEACGIEDEEDA